jgi:hypothetical protein
VAALTLPAWAAGCGSSAQPNSFQCANNAQCTYAQGGECQSIGYCAYPSSTCISGLRYGPDAGTLSNQCVGPGYEAKSPDMSLTSHEAGLVDMGVGPEAIVLGPDMMPPDTLPPTIPAPRIIYPLSTQTVSSHNPTINFVLPGGTATVAAQFQLCSDQACTSPTAPEGNHASAFALANALGQGVHFWRLCGVDAASTVGACTPTYEMWVRNASSGDTEWGSHIDLNADGLADVVVGTNNANQVFVYLGVSTAAWRPSGPSATISGPVNSMTFGQRVTSAGDLDGDGISDLLITDTTTGIAYLYPGKAGSSWTAPAPIVISAATGLTTGAGIGDVNGDGYADLALGGGGTIYVYLGTGAKPWVPNPNPIVLTGTNFGAWIAEAGDVNGDHLSDFCTALGTGSGSNSYVFLGSSSDWAGSTWGGSSVKLTGGWGCADAGDLNSDGVTEVATGPDAVSHPERVYLGTPGGASTWTPGTPITFAAPNSTYGWSQDGVGDVDNDGFDDLLVGDNVSNGYLYNGESPFANTTAEFTFTLPTGTGAGIVSELGDINGDTIPDMIIGDSNSNSAFVYLGQQPGTSLVQVKLTRPTANGFGWSVE